MNPDQLFELNPEACASPRLEWLGSKVPVITIDDLYLHPREIREVALTLDYVQPPYPYPGRLAPVPDPNLSLDRLRSFALDLVNDLFLPAVPVSSGGRRISRYTRIHTDFGIVDLAPSELSPVQRIPHVDPVPVFGLVYLNEEDRGGTVFFEQIADVTDASLEPGYPTGASDAFREVARITPAFNRLVIYPGFVPHSGDIGEWIHGPERLSNPRLTQRLAFVP